MNPEEAGKKLEGEEAILDPEDGTRNDPTPELIGSPRELITLALMGAAVIAFLVFCLPMYIL